MQVGLPKAFTSRPVTLSRMLMLLEYQSQSKHFFDHEKMKANLKLSKTFSVSHYAQWKYIAWSCSIVPWEKWFCLNWERKVLAHDHRSTKKVQRKRSDAWLNTAAPVRSISWAIMGLSSDCHCVRMGMAFYWLSSLKVTFGCINFPCGRTNDYHAD